MEIILLPSVRFYYIPGHSFEGSGIAVWFVPLNNGGIILEQAFLNGQFRSQTGKGPANRLRNGGRIPGIIYGNGSLNTPVEVDVKELNRLLRYYGESSLVGIDLGQGVKTVLIKEVQRDPVTRNVLHVDFQETRSDQKVKTVVPVVILGRESIERDGLILQQQLRELEVECFPHNIPKSVTVDATGMDAGYAMTVGDVELGEEISILNDAGEVIASLTQARTSMEGEDMAVVNEDIEGVSAGVEK
jgi:large subunit ribosomal protein L25